ncbi:MAG: hypothetical protein AAFP02_23135 [Bacteroidota bacterium]
MNAIRSLVVLMLMGLVTPLTAQIDSVYVDSLEQALIVESESGESQVSTLLELATHLKSARRRDTVSRVKGLMYARKAKKAAYQGIEQGEKEKALRLMEFYYRRNGFDDSVRYVNRLLNEFEFLEGFVIPKPDEFAKITYPWRLDQRLQHYHDSTGTKDLEAILGEDASFASLASTSGDYESREGAFWIRFALTSNADEWQTHTFYTGGNQSRWERPHQ